MNLEAGRNALLLLVHVRKLHDSSVVLFEI